MCLPPLSKYTKFDTGGYLSKFATYFGFELILKQSRLVFFEKIQVRVFTVRQTSVQTAEQTAKSYRRRQGSDFRGRITIFAENGRRKSK